MSASSKKKLRSAERAEKMTEKQQAEQREAKKLKIWSTVFVVALALMLCFVAYTAISNAVVHSGIRERNTVALTIGEEKISNAELNYYYIDAVNNFLNNYGQYASFFGLDTTKPLSEQVSDPETGETWADDFKKTAITSIQSVYALSNEAAAKGHTLTEDEKLNVDATIENMEFYAKYYGYTNTEDYLKAMYGYGATEQNFREYLERSFLADSYQNHYISLLTYDDAAIEAESKANPGKYSAFSYNSYYLNVSQFLTGGTTAEDNTVTYSDEEKAAAVQAAEDAAKALAEATTVEELDAAIAGLSINADNESAASTAYTDQAYSSVNSTIVEWVADQSRKAGDITYIPYTTHTHAEGEEHSDDEDASEHETVNGYYVVLFNGSIDNNYPLANVRHILVKFEGGTQDPTTGTTTYSEEEKLAAKTEAEQILADWQAGKAIEDTFATLANEKSDDGDGTTGGLYEDVYPGQMVTNFNDWCFAEDRKVGDTGIVETEYGYHVMFYSGDSETSYREYLIKNALTSADSQAWYDALVEATVVNEENTKYLSTDLVLSQS